ncbi:hypothetical protein ACIRS1_05260 [Kitasatospora sp. NPDC101176]
MTPRIRKVLAFLNRRNAQVKEPEQDLWERVLLPRSRNLPR